MTKGIGLGLFFLFILIANFLLFVFAYNHLATPFLNEAQGVENANWIMQVVLPGYALIAVASTLIGFYISRLKR